jgi:hypothetical protein
MDNEHYKEAIEYLVSLVYEVYSMPLSDDRYLELFYRYDSAVKAVTILTGKQCMRF